MIQFRTVSLVAGLLDSGTVFGFGNLRAMNLSNLDVELAEISLSKLLDCRRSSCCLRSFSSTFFFNSVKKLILYYYHLTIKKLIEPNYTNDMDKHWVIVIIKLNYNSYKKMQYLQSPVAISDSASYN
jgi:hypothetical protein